MLLHVKLKIMSLFDSWKGQNLPAKLWHEADNVPRRHHWAVPAGTVAKRARKLIS